MGFSKDFGNISEDNSDNGLVVYTTSGCPRCDMLKKWLRNKTSGFEERDLEDSEVMTDLVMRNFVVMAAPAIEINGKVFTDNEIFQNNGLIKPEFSRIFGVM